MYKCINCGRRFEEPAYEDVSYEDYCGVGSDFPRASHHYFTLTQCPYCWSTDIDDDIEEDNEDDEE